MYKSMDQCTSNIKRLWLADGPHLSNFVETAIYDAIDVILHRQIRIKDDAKVTHSVEREHINITNT